MSRRKARDRGGGGSHQALPPATSPGQAGGGGSRVRSVGAAENTPAGGGGGAARPQESVSALWSLGNQSARVHVTGFLRPNLFLSANYFGTEKARLKWLQDYVVGEVKRQHDRASATLSASAAESGQASASCEKKKHSSSSSSSSSLDSDSAGVVADGDGANSHSSSAGVDFDVEEADFPESGGGVAPGGIRPLDRGGSSSMGGALHGGDRGGGNGAIIVYAGTRRKAESYAEKIEKVETILSLSLFAPPSLSHCLPSTLSLSLSLWQALEAHPDRAVSSTAVSCYHAGLPDKKRTTVQEAFMRGDARVIVATNAFGMGIDRYVLFALNCLPSTNSAVYSEPGLT